MMGSLYRELTAVVLGVVLPGAVCTSDNIAVILHVSGLLSGALASLSERVKERYSISLSLSGIACVDIMEC